MTGSLRVSGSADVTSVMGDVMRLLGGRGAAGVDHLTVGGLMAQAVGVTPLNDSRPPVRDDLARFGLFIDNAARLGLTPEQTEQVGREVKETPDRRLTAETRNELVEGAVAAGRSREAAEREVNRLEIAARLLPNEITAYGSMAAPSITVAPEVKVEPVITIEADDACQRLRRRHALECAHERQWQCVRRDGMSETLRYHTLQELRALSLDELRALWELVPTDRQRAYRAAYDREVKAAGAEGSDAKERRIALALLKRYHEVGARSDWDALGAGTEAGASCRATWRGHR